MKLKTTNQEKLIQLDGVKAEIDVINDNVNSITVTDKNGKFFKVTPGQYSGIHVSIKEPPKTVKKFKLTGTFAEVDVNKVFDKESDANNERDRLNDIAFSDTLKVTEIEVEVAE